MFLNVFHYFGFLLLKNEFVESLKSEVCHTFVTLKFFIGNVWISFHVTFCTTWNDSLWVVWPQWLLWHCEHILSLDMIGDHLNLQVWWQKFVNPYLLLNVYPQHGRRRIITFEFGKHNDTYFGNLEGHGSPNLLKMKLYISGFWRKRCTGCPKKFSNNEMSVFLT